MENLFFSNEMKILAKKNVLNISNFSLSGGTYVEQTSTSHLIGDCTALGSLQNYSVSAYQQDYNLLRYLLLGTCGNSKGQGNVFLKSH